MTLENNKASIPLVTVCVQTYQHAPFIRECLDGILMQKTNFPFEINLGEDESTDGTREICIEYANNYPDIINLFLNKRKNVIYVDGQATGRWNLLNNINNARGKYIALCPGDDYWTDPYKLQKQVDFLENNQSYVLCFHNALVVYEDNSQRKSHIKKINFKEDMTIEDIINSNDLNVKYPDSVSPGPPSGCVFRNGLIKYFPDFFYKSKSGDLPLFMMLSQFGKAKFINEVTSVYRIHSGGISSQKEHIHNLFQNRINMYIGIKETISDEYNHIINRIISDYYMKIAKIDAMSFRIKNCLSNTLSAIKFFPKRMFVIILLFISNILYTIARRIKRIIKHLFVSVKLIFII